MRQQGKPYESKLLAIVEAGPEVLTDDPLVIDGDIAYWKSGQ